MFLSNGGALAIEDHKPIKGLCERTVENLGLIAGTAMFNVPFGYQMLVEALRADKDLRYRVFADRDMISYVGTAMPPDVLVGLENTVREAQAPSR